MALLPVLSTPLRYLEGGLSYKRNKKELTGKVSSFLFYKGSSEIDINYL